MAKGRCTSCGGTVPMYSSVCPHCGVALTWSGPGVKTLTATCPSCGRYTHSTSRTCEHCGAEIDWARTKQLRSAAKVEAAGLFGSGLMILSGSVALILVLALFVYACH